MGPVVHIDANGRHVQTGCYPAHDIELSRLDGKEKAGACNSPLVLPAQAHVKAPGDALYCTGCKALLVGDETRISAAREAARSDGFDASGGTLRDPAEKPKRAQVDPTKETLELFPQPEYHHGRSGRRAAR